MERTRKPWGWTTPVARELEYHIDRIEVDPGGYCSVHKHERKANVFHVIGGGILYVRQFSAQGGSIAAMHITPGRSFVVPAGEWHQFYAQNGAVALEVYMPTAERFLLVDDIERHPKFAEGGIGSYGELSSLLRDAFNVEQYEGIIK